MALNVERLSKGTSEYTKNGGKREMWREGSGVGALEERFVLMEAPSIRCRLRRRSGREFEHNIQASHPLHRRGIGGLALMESPSIPL